MRIVFAWFDISGYMAACWRALAAETGVQVKIIAYAPDPHGKAPFSSEILGDVPHRLLDRAERSNSGLIADAVAAEKPDVLVISGWAHPPYLNLLSDPRLANARIAMAMDTPWRGTLRQWLGRFKIRRLRDRLHRVIVAGERSFLLARNLGFPEERIRKGAYGYDDARFAAAFERRQLTPEHPRRFLFTGMYDQRKGLDLILDAYAGYRNRVSSPWPLTCCGTGELNSRVSASPGVINRGFVQPFDLPDVFAEHGVFLLASRYEPWGVVIAEALASGMPVICTHACGASVELIRPFYNGLTLATGSATALFHALTWAHENHTHLSEMGRRGRVFARAHSSALWATNLVEMFSD